MIESIQIRRATCADIPALCLLLEQFLGDYPGASLSQFQDGLLALVTDETRSVVIVAELNGCILGMATLQILISTLQGGKTGVIEDLVVERRHQSRGIGQALMATMSRVANRLGLTRLQCRIEAEAVRPLQFFSAQGWRSTTERSLQMQLCDHQSESEENPSTDAQRQAQLIETDTFPSMS